MAPIQLLPHPGLGLWQVHPHNGFLHINASPRPIGRLAYGKCAKGLSPINHEKAGNWGKRKNKTRILGHKQHGLSGGRLKLYISLSLTFLISTIFNLISFLNPFKNIHFLKRNCEKIVKT